MRRRRHGSIEPSQHDACLEGRPALQGLLRPRHSGAQRPTRPRCAAGQVALKLKTARRDGTMHLAMNLLAFMQRLAALLARRLVLPKGVQRHRCMSDCFAAKNSAQWMSPTGGWVSSPFPDGAVPAMRCGAGRASVSSRQPGDRDGKLGRAGGGLDGDSVCSSRCYMACAAPTPIGRSCGHRTTCRSGLPPPRRVAGQAAPAIPCSHRGYTRLTPPTFHPQHRCIRNGASPDRAIRRIRAAGRGETVR